MKGSLSYDTSSSDPILTVVGMVFLLLILPRLVIFFAEQGDHRYAEERRRESLITQLRSEWISHLKGLLSIKDLHHIGPFLQPYFPSQTTWRDK
jgi:hypothetical protein